jgi:hypothetical protein
LGDHSWRSLYFSRRHGRIIVRFKRHISRGPRCGRELSRSARERNE